MERQNYNILNRIYQEVYQTNIDTDTYNNLVKVLIVDRSAGSLARIREYLISQKTTIDNNLTSLNGREIIMLEDNLPLLNEIPDMSSKKILLISVIKNVAQNIIYIKSFLEDLCTKFECVNYYFLTNNNTDNTVKILKSLIADNLNSNNLNINGTFSEDFDYTKIMQKNSYIAQLRNQCYNDACNSFSSNDFDYLIVLDTKITSPIYLDSFMSSFQLNMNWDIISGNMTFKKSSYHQDIFSLRLLSDDLDITTKYKYIEKFYGKSTFSSLYWIDKLYCFNSFYKVQSAYSGIMIINKKVFKLKQLWNDNLGPYESEHVSLCTKFANVYINSNLNFQYDINIEGILYNDPYIFIPRDAGFFSVFNYLIGSIITGSRIYPYYNKNKIVEKNKQLKHFSYLDENIENSWFDFYQPIKYYDNDITHESNDIQLYNLTIGEYAADEFKYPYKTKELYNLPNFKEWRIDVNKYLKKYIKPTQEIKDRSDIIISEFGDNNIIGVLVRHPAHSIEEDSPVLFTDYFEKIDKILDQYPQALIYLVTDTDMAIGAFMLKYNTKLLYDKNIQRLSHDNIIEWANSKTKGVTDNIGFVNGKGYELQNINISNMNTENGKDMVTNVIVLSKCKWFIYPNSNISLAVSYFGPDVEMISVR